MAENLPDVLFSASANSIVVEYELTKEDLTAFNLYHQFHSPAARRQYLRSWFIPALIWFLFCTGIWYLVDQKRGTPLRTFLDLLPLFSGVPIYLVYFPWAYRRKFRKIIDNMVSEGQNRGLLCRHRVTLSPEGIVESAEFSQTSTSWRAVERIARNVDYVFVYINAMAAVIVPRRAFPNATEFEAFVRTVTEFADKAIKLR